MRHLVPPDLRWLVVAPLAATAALVTLAGVIGATYR